MFFIKLLKYKNFFNHTIVYYFKSKSIIFYHKKYIQLIKNLHGDFDKNYYYEEYVLLKFHDNNITSTF